MTLRIVVCVKIVPRAAVPLRLDPATARLDRSGATELNPSDTYAIEEALRLREASGGEVVLLSMSLPEGAEALRAGLAMGADRAILLADPALTGSDLLGTSTAIAAALERERPDLVVFGGASVDGTGALLWAAVAERLALPVISGIREVAVADGVVTTERQVLGGEERIDCPLPCVISVGGSVNTPRYPAFRDIVQAKKKEIREVSLGDVGLDATQVGKAGSGTEVLGIAGAPPRRSAGEVIEDDGRGAAWLAERLAARRLA